MLTTSRDRSLLQVPTSTLGTQYTSTVHGASSTLTGLRVGSSENRPPLKNSITNSTSTFSSRHRSSWSSPTSQMIANGSCWSVPSIWKSSRTCRTWNLNSSSTASSLWVTERPLCVDVESSISVFGILLTRSLWRSTSVSSLRTGRRIIGILSWTDTVCRRASVV